jgi:hypothetical protein
MRPTLRAVSARLIVGHLDPEEAAELLAVIESRDKPVTFALAEPEGLGFSAAVPAGAAAQAARSEPVRWGKLLLETAANEALSSSRPELCDALVDALGVAHRRLGPAGLDLVPRGSSGVGFCSATLIDGAIQLVVVPPAQVFVVHQGIAVTVPPSSEVGRGIWVRDDLRPEIFAGVGGAHEPDIRVYDAEIGSGDAVVLVSSSLARVLTEDEVRAAVAYEEAVTGAERLKQLAIQRGVEAGVALVVEIAGSLEAEAERVPASSIQLSRRALPRVEMPPIGSIFSTAREWLLDAVDRVHQADASSGGSSRPSCEEDVRWPVRPTPGAWRAQFQEMKRVVVSSRPVITAPVASPPPEPEPEPASAPRPSRLPPPTWRRYAQPASKRRLSLPPLGRFFSAALPVLRAFNERLSRVDFAGRRHLLMPLFAAACVVLVFFGAMRTIKAQQARQLQQRFDSLVTAAAQLETQARNEPDRGSAQSLVRRAEALLDQAATLQPNQPKIAAVRKDLEADLERLDSIFALPGPALLASVNSVGKDVNPTLLAIDPNAAYLLDASGQRVIQYLRQSKQLAVIASKGDKSGPNQLAPPRLIAPRENGLLILDSSRNLWSWSGNKLQQIGLKSQDAWREPAAMAAYGPNLYILDPTVGNVFRYVSREGLFGDPPSRLLEKDTPDLRQGVSLTIDGAVWVLGADGQILRYENGARQPFGVTGLPQPLSKPAQLYTEANWRSLYVLAGNNRVVEIAKDGRYLRQFNLGQPATAFWPDERARQLYVLSGANLYQYQLPPA